MYNLNYSVGIDLIENIKYMFCFSDPIKVDIYPINRVYQLGFTAKLQCRATGKIQTSSIEKSHRIHLGYPLPRITWMRNNLPLANTSRIRLQSDGSLVIHPYKREDAGMVSSFLVKYLSKSVYYLGPYVCNATNKKESVTQVAYLEVKGNIFK